MITVLGYPTSEDVDGDTPVTLGIMNSRNLNALHSPKIMKMNIS